MRVYSGLERSDRLRFGRRRLIRRLCRRLSVRSSASYSVYHSMAPVVPVVDVRAVSPVSLIVRPSARTNTIRAQSFDGTRLSIATQGRPSGQRAARRIARPRSIPSPPRLRPRRRETRPRHGAQAATRVRRRRGASGNSAAPKRRDRRRARDRPRGPRALRWRRRFTGAKSGYLGH